MRKWLLVALFVCLTGQAFGSETDVRVTLTSESLENGTASSIGIYVGDLLYGGLSLNHITASRPIQNNNRQTIFPVYLVMGLKAPWRLSPYIEGGVDLPEALIDELFDNEDNSLDRTDYFMAGGLTFAVTDRLSCALYAKRYRFKFLDAPVATVKKVTSDGIGVGLSFHF